MFNPRQYYRAISFALLACLASTTVFAADDWPKTPPTEPPADWGPVSANFEEIEYPYPVKFLKLNRFKQDMLLAYMDVAPAGKANGQTVLIQHGMNFYSEAYEVVIKALSEEGFRVLAVDRIGYGKSSKPIIPYDFNFVAANMKDLLDELEIKEVAIVGHSMGGMVVSRFAMMYADMTTHVVMVNQIGLTDQRQGRPWRDPYVAELSPSSYRGILAGHRRYFPGDWPPAHLKYVKRQYGQTMSGEWPRLVMVRRLQGQMLYEDPVVYDWQHIKTKALVMGGEKDGLVADFPTLAKNVADQLQNSALLLYPNIGHAPHVEIPDQFNKDLIRFLKSDPKKPASDWK
ncbi:alpha/beta hydrolase [Aurantivibrio infirmus]